MAVLLALHLDDEDLEPPGEDAESSPPSPPPATIATTTECKQCQHPHLKNKHTCFKAKLKRDQDAHLDVVCGTETRTTHVHFATTQTPPVRARGTSMSTQTPRRTRENKGTQTAGAMLWRDPIAMARSSAAAQPRHKQDYKELR